MRPKLLSILTIFCFLSSCTAGTNTNHTTLSPEIVKIGLVAPFEGRYRSLGYEVIYAVKLALYEYNQSHKETPFRLELVALNDNADPKQSALQAQKLVLDPDVIGVIGPFSEPSLEAAAPHYEKTKLSVITPAMCPSVRSPYVFCWSVDGKTTAQAIKSHIASRQKVLLLNFNNGPLGQALTSSAKHTIMGPWDEQELMLEIVHSRVHYAELYLYDGDVLTAATLLVALEENNINAPFFGGPALAHSQLPQIAGQAAQDVCYIVTRPIYADLNTESTFSQDYAQLSGTRPGPWAGLAYDSASVLISALEKAIETSGKVERKDIGAQIDSLENSKGQLLFVQQQRANMETDLYCYGPEPVFPGELRE